MNLTSKSAAQLGALMLGLGLGAHLVCRQRSVRRGDGNPAADAAIPHFVFAGERSEEHSLAVSALRAVGAVMDSLGVDVGTQIAPLIAFEHPPFFTVSGLNVKCTEVGGYSMYVIASDTPSDKYVVALHGGAYVVQPTINHWSAYATIVRHTNATVLVPIYPLASTPEGRAQDVIPALADVISCLTTRHGANDVSVYGDSAGGGMALAIAQLMVRRGESTPSRMVLISPWLDVTLSNPSIDAVRDPVLRIESLRRAGQRWAGDLSPKDPLVSPIYGSLAGLPPTAVYCGNLDLLAPDVLQLRELALATECSDFTFVLRNGAIHDWAMGGARSTREASAVQNDIYVHLGLSRPTDDYP